MADEDEVQAAPAPTDGMNESQIASMLRQLQNPAPVAPRGDSGSSSREGRGFLSLLGEALGGGSQYGTTEEREQAGIGALGAMGMRMLAASDYSTTPHTLGSIIAQGQGGARESLASSQRVSAARAGAEQQYQSERETRQLERLKAALPLLTLQQRIDAVKGTPATLTGDIDSGGSIGTGADTYVGAIGGHEGTGKNPNSSAVGVGQFLDSTWADFMRENPSYFAGMSPEQAMAARKNPEFGAKVGPVAIEWLAKKNADALTGAGVTPSGQSLGIAHYLGAGTAAKVMAAPDGAPMSGFVSPAALAANPELRTMTAGQMRQRYARTPAPTFLQAGTPTAPPTSPSAGRPRPATAPGVNPNAQVQIPPPPAPGAGPGAPPGGGSPLPAPEAPIAPGAGAQVAGPGAPTTGAVPPSPPSSDAAVADIRAGMISAGADPTTLAPGARMAAVPGGGVAIAAGPEPGSFEEYQLKHPIAPGDDDRAGFRVAPDPAQLAGLAEQRRQAEQAYVDARRAGDIGAMNKARADRVQAIVAENTLRENAAKLGTDTRSKYYDRQREQQFNAWTAERTRATEIEKEQRARAAAIEDEERKHQNALALEKAKSDDARRTAAEASETTYRYKQREQFDTARDQIRTNLDNFQMLKAFSSTAGTSGTLDNVQYNGRSGRDIMSQMGLGTEAKQKQWGAQQAFEALINRTVIGLRAGVSMGPLSDKDMNFLQHMAPEQLQNPKTRADIISYLEQTEIRKRDYMDEVERLHDDGKGLSWGRARREADKARPAFPPELPADFATLSNEEKLAFIQRERLEHGSLVRKPDGTLTRYLIPGMK